MAVAVARSLIGNQAEDSAAGADITIIPVIPFMIEQKWAVYVKAVGLVLVNTREIVPAAIHPQDKSVVNPSPAFSKVQQIGPTKRMKTIVPQFACIATVDPSQFG